MDETYTLAAGRNVWHRTLPYVLLSGSIVGLTASFALTYDKLQVLRDSAYQPACNINPILSCGSVMSSSQAEIAGIPNTIFGLVGYSLLAMFALTLLAGATYQRWLWITAQLTAAAGVIFVHYLFFQSVFRIHAICPWCFTVWMATIPVFFGITIHNIRSGYLTMGGRLRPAGSLLNYISSHATDILVLWYLLIFGTLLVRFWYFWSTLL